MEFTKIDPDQWKKECEYIYIIKIEEFFQN